MLKAKKALNELFEGIYELICPKKTEEGKENTQAVFEQLDNGIILVKLNPFVKSLVERCADLFFFYQTDEPFLALQLHDYGFF